MARPLDRLTGWDNPEGVRSLRKMLYGFGYPTPRKRKMSWVHDLLQAIGLKRARDSWRRECLAWESQAAGLHEALATERSVSDRLRAEVAAAEGRVKLLETEIARRDTCHVCGDCLLPDRDGRCENHAAVEDSEIEERECGCLYCRARYGKGGGE